MIDLCGKAGASPEVDRLITCRLSELNISPFELVKKWGYANSGKGLRRLSQLRIGDFVPDAQGIASLANALNVPIGELTESINTTKSRIEALRLLAQEQEWLEWSLNFRPHALLRTDRTIPSPIFVAAIIGPERILKVEVDENAPPIQWPKLISKELPERVAAFGNVIGFYINYSPEYAVGFDRNGTPVSTHSIALRPGQAWMEAKGKNVTPQLRKALNLKT